MESSGVCCCFGSHRRATLCAAALGLVQAIILLPLAIVALLKQIWDVQDTPTEITPLLPLYIYYFHNPNGDNGHEANPLAFRTQILAIIYTVLCSLWLILSIALLSNAKSRGSAWTHYTWGTVTAAIIVVDLVASLMYGRDAVVITDLNSLSKETGYELNYDGQINRYLFILPPLVMIAIFSKGVILWIFNIFFVWSVFSAGQRSQKASSRQEYNRYQENARTLTQSMTASQSPVSEPAAAAIAAVTRSHSSVSTDVKSDPPSERVQALKMVNEELTARLQNDSSPRNFQLERAGRRPASPLVAGSSRPSSRQAAATPEASPAYTNASVFTYTQGIPQEPTRPPPRRPDSRARYSEDNESANTWVEGPTSPQSPLRKDAIPDTWWLPGDEELQRRAVQPRRPPVSELRAQLPWTYFQTPLELDPATLQSTPPTAKKNVDSRRPPTIPAPDYTLHMQRGRHRSSTRALREMADEPNEQLSRSASDVGYKRLPNKGLRSRNVHAAPFVITDASARSPHFLRRPLQYPPGNFDTRE